VIKLLLFLFLFMAHIDFPTISHTYMVILYGTEAVLRSSSLFSLFISYVRSQAVEIYGCYLHFNLIVKGLSIWLIIHTHDWTIHNIPYHTHDIPYLAYILISLHFYLSYDIYYVWNGMVCVCMWSLSLDTG